ncbi:MAG: peptidoglycan DD-metalloendopeptidase family protein [Burkholderiales bacterium]
MSDLIPFGSMTSSRGRFARVLAIALVVAVAGCASRTRAPVEDRSAQPSRPPQPPVAAAPAPASAPEAPSGPTYTVRRGDTLYQIALDSGLDYRELAAWNNIENVNLIRVGQVLRLTAPGSESPASPTGVVTAPLRSAPTVVEARPGAPAAASTSSPASPPPPAAVARNTDALKTQPKAFKEPYSEQALKDAARVPVAPATPAPSSPPDTVAMATPPAAASPGPKAEAPAPRPPANDAAFEDDDRIEWVWPAKGKVVGTFSETANLKGIDIAGSAGQPILASASGTVVYAGSGLRGYGKLVIVKHNGTYLSAYAHNREILVKEGDKVAKGQKIAEMGNTDATEVKLHFEIRRKGKPMDPVRYLPPA